ncbi:MAG: COX15/CtaA family protein [Gemmatimonadales bacterium]|jgi:cytochrome c oxidase assembly protein subunit 15|nr:COX15/CtaA family protein [Gemmatimonadales bacterium]
MMPDDTLAEHRRAGRWLAAWAAMVFLTVLIGGATRLTESGLSITEWKPVSGIVPPLSEADWQAEFAKYQQIPEYQQLNRGMSLADFKRIFLWEYGHRVWARLVGLAFAVPFLWFLWRRRLDPAIRGRLWLVLVLTGLQAAMGWYMVKSGLSERTDVSQYRLAAHLALALVIYLVTIWTAADLLRRDAEPLAAPAGLRSWALALAGLTFVTAVAGAFVAGLDAGRAYNTFPLMGGRVVPAGYLQLAPWWRNFFEHVPTVQFNHRLLGVGTVLLALALWRRARASRHPTGRPSALPAVIAAVALFQLGLGIATLLLAVPVALGVLHQAGAVALLTAAVLLVHRLRRDPWRLSAIAAPSWA